MSWQKTKISEFLIERTDRFKPDEANELGLPRIEKIDFSGTIYINNFKPTKTGMILVKDGDLVISGINVEKGALAIYKGETDALATIHYSSYTYDDNKIDIEYLKWYLQSNIFKNILKEQVKGGIKTEIKPKTFLNLEIMLPDVETQKSIASKLNKLEWNVKDLDFTCFCNKELIDKLRQSILQNAIQGKLVPQNPNDEPASELLKRIECCHREKPIKCNLNNELNVIPKGWIYTHLGNVVENFKYGTSEKSNYNNKGIPVIRIPNIVNNKISLKDLKYLETHNVLSNNKVKNGDILIIRSNGSKELVGKTALVEDLEQEYAFASYLIRLRPIMINCEFLIILLNSYIVKNQFMNLASTTVGINNINSEKLSKINIVLPPLKEQERIVKKVKELMQLCDKLENENSNAQKFSSELLQSIMQKYFTPEV